jgi:hypothetical protein
MSEPQHIVVSNIRLILQTRILSCGSFCSKCRNTSPGCKSPQEEKDRLLLNRQIGQINQKYTNHLLNNRADLFFIFRCASNGFPRFTSEKFLMLPKTASQTALLDPKKMFDEIKHQLLILNNIPANASRQMAAFSNYLKWDSFDQKKVWSAFFPFLETDFPSVSSHIPRKKGLMLSFALWILMKRLLPRKFFESNLKKYEDNFFHRVIFARIFNARLVRKKGSPKFNRWTEDPMKSNLLLTNLR